jgi:hypothetical protein
VANEDQPRMPPAPRRRARLSEGGGPDVLGADPPPRAPAAKASVDLFHAKPPAEPLEAVPPSAQRSPAAEPAPAPAAAPQAPKPQQPARQVAESPSSASVVGVVVVAGQRSPETALRAAAASSLAVVFVAQSNDAEAAETARRAGIETVEVPDRALTAGRARNAGYRQLKKRLPDLQYVQFVDSDLTLDAQWLAGAARFMERRPEVAAIEGKIRFENEGSSVFARVSAIEINGEAGETDVVGANLFVRADAFEGAGGFRGDLTVNETRDLCIRLRRRGAHIWRLDAWMGVVASRSDGLAGFWEASVHRGYEYAHGAALHGAPPDRLFAGERARALLWGAFLPSLVATAAIAAAVYAALFAPLSNPLLYGLSALAVGVLVYLIKVVVVAASLGGRPGAWPFAFWSTVGRVGEALGGFAYFLGRGKPRQKKPD